MEALILSCGTGGGHNAAAAAIANELRSRGHQVEILDPYALVGDRLAITISNAYIRLVQKLPGAFGCLYFIANLVRKLPFVSPVYLINRKMSKYMHQFLAKRHFDVIVMPHLFPRGDFDRHEKERAKITPNAIYCNRLYLYSVHRRNRVRLLRHPRQRINGRILPPRSRGRKAAAAWDSGKRAVFCRRYAGRSPAQAGS